MPATKKTDNHYLADKVALRIKHSCWPADNKPLRVLDCFGGKGVVWAAVGKTAGKDIERTAIDERIDLVQFHIHGDNARVICELNLTEYDVIDLDAYGIPAEQIDLVIKSGFRGVVFVTAIQTMHGGLPHKLMDDLCFPAAIKELAPSLVARRGWDYLKEWLCSKGVKAIVHRSKGRKHYFCFTLSGAAESEGGSGSLVEDTVVSPS